MGNEWQAVTVAEIAAPIPNAIVGGPFGSNLVSRDYVASGVPVIRGQNMRDRWVSGGFAFVSESKAESLSANLARPGDVVFTQRGTLGQVSLVPPTPFDRYVVSQSQMKLTVNPEVADAHFIYYAFSSHEQREHIRKHALQTGVPHTNLGILRSTPLALPPLTEQRAIALILRTLDDKIELNRRMSQTLEGMARTLFKSWFVDFDPVYAKAEGRAPCLPQCLARLFPDKFKDSHFGEIPAGWRVGSILEQAELLSGGTPKTAREEYWGGSVPWASAKDVSQCADTVLLATERTITETGLDESATRLIPELATVVVARGATTGRTVLFGREMAMNQTCYALVTKIEVPFALHCQFGVVVRDLVHAAHGSIFDTITTRTFKNTRVLLPPPHVLRAFEQSVAPLFERAITAIRESRTLAAVRDALLPRLVSGEFRLDDPAQILRRID